MHTTKAYTNPKKDLMSSLKYIYQNEDYSSLTKRLLSRQLHMQYIIYSSKRNNESYDNIAYEFGVIFSFQDLVDVITRQLASSRRKHKDLKCN